MSPIADAGNAAIQQRGQPATRTRNPPRPAQFSVRTGFRAGAPEGVLSPLPLGKVSLIITGVARGGTSFAASVCHHLGVDLGRHGPRYEDQKLARPLLEGNARKLKGRLNAERNPQTAFGWKLPALNYHLDEVSAMLSAPRFIFILRDPVAVSLRKQLAPETRGNPLRDARRVIEALQRMFAFLDRTEHPCLMLSYEKGLSNPVAAVQDLAEFIGRAITLEEAEAISVAVARDQSSYVTMRDTADRPEENAGNAA